MRRKRRRAIQQAHNEKYNITPTTIKKEIRDVIRATYAAEDTEVYQESLTDIPNLPKDEQEKVIEQMEKEMKEAAKALNFEKATELRDIIFELKAENE